MYLLIIFGKKNRFKEETKKVYRVPVDFSVSSPKVDVLYTHLC